MSNNHNSIFNINQQAARPWVLNPRNRPILPNLPENGLISAIIAQKNENGTMLTLENGESLNIRRGEIAGEVGDNVFFEVTRNNEGTAALRQVFPEAHQQNLLSHVHSVKSLKDLMLHQDYAVAPQNPLDAAALAESHAELRDKANRAVAQLTRSIDRIAGNTRGAAVAQLAAAGINIDKISISMLDSVTAQLDAAVAQNSPKIVEELHNKLDSIMNMGDEQIARLLQSGAPLTLDNLYIYKHSGKGAVQAEPLPEAVWQDLQGDIANFFKREGLENNAENLARARFLLDNGLALDADNFDRLIFLTDIEGNIDFDALAQAAISGGYSGQGLGGLEIYNPEANEAQELKNIDHQLQLAEARLAMSYEAKLALGGTDLEIDLDPQIEALKQLRERERELLAALRELGRTFDTPENQKAITDTFRSIFTLPFASFADFGAIAQNRGDLNFTLQGLESLIASHTYEANATVFSIKHGDAFNKIAEQFAPLLRQMGLSDDAHNIRAAKILTMNNMEINPENLLRIKTIDAKIADVQNRLHPRLAAQMIADGHIPAAMHVDELLEHMAKYNDDFGTNENDMLYRNIAELDSRGDITGDVRAKMIEIYQMLNKISKNNGAGIGFAVNAGIELTLQNLVDFAKNFRASGGRRNTINYAVEDGTYYAKHLVSSFISAAKPRPLAHFTQNEPLTEPLATSVDKIEDIAREMVRNGEISDELDVDAVNRAIAEMTGSKENIRFLVNLGVPVTLANLRQMKAYRERKLDEDLQVLDAAELAQIVEGLIDDVPQAPIAQNESLMQQVEQAAENATDTGKITKLDLLMQNLNFRQMMLENPSDYSFAMGFNGRVADVAMYVVNENMSIDADGGVTAFLSLKTAMGDVQGLVNLSEGTAHIRFASSNATNQLLAENMQNLADAMANIGFENVDISFAEVSAMKKQLSMHTNLPI